MRSMIGPLTLLRERLRVAGWRRHSRWRAAGGGALGEHGLAAARRAGEREVMAARRADLQAPAAQRLAAYICQVGDRLPALRAGRAVAAGRRGILVLVEGRRLAAQVAHQG